MTFFYDLNKKLDTIRAKPETTHKQLNERDEGKPGKNFEKIARGAAERYGSKAAGERVAGAVRNKLKAQGKLEEADMDESAFQAAIGKKKYGADGMKALQKAGREGASKATMNRIRDQHDQYDEGIEDRIGDLDPKNPVNIPAYQRKAAEQGRPVKNEAGLPMTTVNGKRVPKFAADGHGANDLAKKKSFADKIAGAKKEVDEMLGDVAAEAMKSALSPKQKKIDMNKNGRLDANDFAMLRKGNKSQQADMDEASQDNAFTAHKRPREETPKVGDVEHGSKHDITHGTTDKRYSGRIVTRRTDAQGMSVGTDDAPADGAPRGRGRPKKAGGPAQERITAKSRKADRTTYQGKKKATEGADDPAERGEYDREGDMALDDIDTIQSAAQELQSIIDTDENLPEWVQSKINKAMDYLDTARDYMAAQGNDDEEQVTEKAKKPNNPYAIGMAAAMKSTGDKPPLAKKTITKAHDIAKSVEQDQPKKKKKEKTEEAGGTDTPTASSGFSYGKGIYDSINRELESMISESMSVNMSMNSDAHGGPSKSLTVTATDEDAVQLGKLLKMAGIGGAQGGCGCGSTPCSCGSNAEVVDENKPDWPTNTETSHDALQYSGGLNEPKPTGQTTVPVIASQEERQMTYESDLARMMEMAGAKVGDMIDYVSPSGEQPPEDLIMQSGVQYDPDTNIISVPNSTQMANTHRAIEAAGWKKQSAGARPNPMADRQAQMAGDTPYQLGEEDDLARMMEMAGVRGKRPDYPDLDKDHNTTEPISQAAKDAKEKKVDESIMASTASLWKEYKGQYGV